MTLLTKLIEAGAMILDKRTSANKNEAIFDEIEGYSGIKKEFVKALDPSGPLSVLLCGPPGCGKSEFLKQIRNHLPLKYCSRDSNIIRLSNDVKNKLGLSAVESLIAFVYMAPTTCSLTFQFFTRFCTNMIAALRL